MMQALDGLGTDLSKSLFALIDIDRFKAIHASLGDDGADQVLRQTARRLGGLKARLFRAGGDSFAVRKPDPGHVLGTLAQAGGEPNAAIMVGDHANDVKAAKGAGITCIFAGWGYGAPAMAEGASAIAPDFAALPALAGRLLNRPA